MPPATDSVTSEYVLCWNDFDDNASMFVALFDYEEYAWFPNPGIYGSDNTQNVENYRPIYWMPLPPSPNSQELIPCCYVSKHLACRKSLSSWNKDLGKYECSDDMCR